MGMDSDPILTPGFSPDDLASIFVDVFSHIQFKFLGLLLIVFIILNTDVFTNRVMSQFNGTVNIKCLTNWGVFLQGLILVLLMGVIDTLIRQKIL